MSSYIQCPQRTKLSDTVPEENVSSRNGRNISSQSGKETLGRERERKIMFSWESIWESESERDGGLENVWECVWEREREPERENAWESGWVWERERESERMREKKIVSERERERERKDNVYENGWRAQKSFYDVRSLKNERTNECARVTLFKSFLNSSQHVWTG